MTWIAANERYMRILAAVVVVAAVVLVVVLRDFLPSAREAGYAGIFVLSLVNSAVVFIPMPALAAIYFGGAFLNPWAVAVIAGIGMGIGETVPYLLGFSSQRLAARHRWYPRISAWLRQRGVLVLFLFALIPNPVFDIVGVVAGNLRYPFLRFVLVVTTGKTAKALLVALSGALSLPFILELYETLFPSPIVDE